MNPFHISFGLRILLTPILFYSQRNIPLTILFLIILDVLDCNPLVIHFFTKEQKEEGQYCSKNPTYEVMDKIVDILQLALAGWLLRQNLLITSQEYLLYNSFLLYRSIGVYKYWLDNNEANFIPFFDIGKELLFLIWITGNRLTWGEIIGIIIVKVAYEIMMHKYHGMIKLYKYLFELPFNEDVIAMLPDIFLI